MTRSGSYTILTPFIEKRTEHITSVLQYIIASRNMKNTRLDNHMSASIILKNIFEFAKILNSASHQSVTLWDDQSLKNALDWADYCQELFTQIKGQEYEEDVNRQLSQMTAFLDPVSCLRISVDALGCARSLLLETLMSNPSFPPLSKKKLIIFLHDHSDGVRILEEVQKKLSASDACLQVCTDLLNFLSDRSDDINFRHSLKSEYQATVLMQNLTAAVQNINKCERFEKYCCTVYNKLTETQEGWNILINLFTVENGDLPYGSASEQSKILNDFLIRMKQTLEQDISASHFWSVPVEVLVKASSVSKQFFHIYLDALIALGDSYMPQIDDRGFIFWRISLQKSAVTQADRLWRIYVKSASGHTLKELCFHFQRLLETSASVSQERQVRILGAVTDLVKGTYFTVWRELVQSLVQVLKQG